MYYRYKSKKRAKKTYEVVLIAVLIALAAAALFHYRSYFFFWKFTYNRLQKQVYAGESINDAKEKKEYMGKVITSCDDYRNDNPFQSESYYLSARAHYTLAEAETGSSLSDAVINDSMVAIPAEAKGHFSQTIRFVRKGMSFDSKSRPDDETYAILAKACFYLDFYNSAEIQSILSMIRSPKSLISLDDRRFYGLMLILNGDPDAGVQFLVNNGDIQRDERGKLFLASSYSIAKQYTNAIIEYRSLVDSGMSMDIVKKARIGLGKVYFRQSLFKEAMGQFEESVKSDPSDSISRLWIARCYMSMGDRFTAKKIGLELLEADTKNREVQELLLQLQ